MRQAAIDRFDCRLLLELSEHGRMSNVDLAEAVHLSTTAVARRQRSLEELGVIRGYHADINPATFGLNTTVIVQIALNCQRETELSEFEEAVRTCDSVLRCFLMSGSDDYLLILLVRDLVDYERVHKTQLSRLPHIARIQSSFAMREVVRRMLPADALRD